jgi:hypothetical protein
MFHHLLVRRVGFGGAVLPKAAGESWPRHHPTPTGLPTSSDLPSASVDRAGVLPTASGSAMIRTVIVGDVPRSVSWLGHRLVIVQAVPCHDGCRPSHGHDGTMPHTLIPRLVHP